MITGNCGALNLGFAQFAVFHFQVLVQVKSTLTTIIPVVKGQHHADNVCEVFCAGSAI